MKHLCDKCEKPITSGQKVILHVGPIEVTKSTGLSIQFDQEAYDSSLLVYHQDCVANQPQKTETTDVTPQVDNNITARMKNLSCMLEYCGAKYNVYKLKTFIEQHKQLEDDQLLLQWFNKQAV